MGAATIPYSYCYLAVISFLELSYANVSNLKSLSFTHTKFHVWALAQTAVFSQLMAVPFPTFEKGRTEATAPR